jgi:hypothetical protein
MSCMSKPRGARMSSRFCRTGAAPACVTLVLLTVMTWNASGVAACACGDVRGAVVANGRSLHGIPWRIKAGLARSRGQRGSWDRAIEVHFSIGRENGSTGTGYVTHLGFPLHPEFVLTANEGREIDDYPEGDVSGVTRRDVRTLTIEMSDGESLIVQPALAPSHLLKRFKWLRGVRFYDAFFRAAQSPRIITAVDRNGHVLARYRNHRGVFR